MTYSKPTKALCVLCNKIVPAEIIDIRGRLYLKKFCDTDGVHAIKLLNDSRWFINLDKFQAKLAVSQQKQKNFSIVCSGTCNMECPICYFDWYKEKLSDISLAKIQNLVTFKDNLILYGAESLCHADIDSFISFFKEQKKQIPPLITNGLLFATSQYTQELKNNGLSNVFFQFDGFDKEANKILRGRDYTDAKLKALDNLAKANVDVSFYSVIKKYVNEGEIKNIFDLALAHKNIKEIAFLSYIEFSTDRKSVLEYESKNLLFDELIELVLSSLKLGDFSTFMDFQKIFLFVLGLRKEKGCLSNAYYFVFMIQEKKYLPQYFWDTKAMLKSIDMFLSASRFRRLRKLIVVRRIFFLMQLLGKIYYKKIPFLLTSILQRRFKFLKLKIVKCCSPYDFDTDKMRTCGTGVIFASGDKVYKKDKFSISPYYKLHKGDNIR